MPEQEKPKVQSSFIAGLDLGQRQDYTAFVLIERKLRTGLLSETEAAALPEVKVQWKPTYDIRALHRFELGTPYTDLVTKVKTWLAKFPGCLLALDQTGVGTAVVEMFKAARIPRMEAITITSGRAATKQPDGSWNVAKVNLVGILQVLLAEQRLRWAKELTLAPLLAKELDTFKAKVTAAGNETYEAWREKDHDDLVLAVALACWSGERPRPRLFAKISNGGEDGLDRPVPSWVSQHQNRMFRR